MFCFLFYFEIVLFVSVTFRLITSVGLPSLFAQLSLNPMFRFISCFFHYFWSHSGHLAGSNTSSRLRKHLRKQSYNDALMCIFGLVGHKLLYLSMFSHGHIFLRPPCKSSIYVFIVFFYSNLLSEIFWRSASTAVFTVNKLSAVARWWSKSMIIPLLGNGDPLMCVVSLVCLGWQATISDVSDQAINKSQRYQPNLKFRWNEQNKKSYASSAFSCF